MQRRRLGGLFPRSVSVVCATMTPFCDEPERDSAVDTLRCAQEIGVDLLDSSDAYAVPATGETWAGVWQWLEWGNKGAFRSPGDIGRSRPSADIRTGFLHQLTHLNSWTRVGGA